MSDREHDHEPIGRASDERLADHAAIERLLGELLPALVAKLGASGLGELDIREDAWRVRLRMPGDGRGSRRSGTGSARGSGRSDGQAGGGIPARLPQVPVVSAGPAPGPGAFDAEARGAFDDPRRVVATSPAVGFFRPAADRGAGDRVRAGDRLGVVDVLGVPHELVAPVDGIVGASLAESGEPVEYGQALVEIELLGMPTAERGEGS